MLDVGCFPPSFLDSSFSLLPLLGSLASSRTEKSSLAIGGGTTNRLVSNLGCSLTPQVYATSPARLSSLGLTAGALLKMPPTRTPPSPGVGPHPILRAFQIAGDGYPGQAGPGVAGVCPASPSVSARAVGPRRLWRKGRSLGAAGLIQIRAAAPGRVGSFDS